ncbi:ABC transporter permease [Solirubrobacter sp. CPCC 204708]|uniref:ABC transporter permease n=1 Tax=Solirubrobacter deserti TaxID=2282478 RepID=A0ABT4RL08_9ACTN|nr:ABC transporter permease [Solirubrobacter deserti]MBE2319034.1 ABC transporter permease [Solirubrobacter deserti]MDA0139242.1 ABC transporter permease [Solirubrobacter deserti]
MRDRGFAVGEALLAVAIALAVGALFVLIADDSPATAYEALWTSSVGSTNALAQSMTTAIPIIVVGLGMGLAFRVGLFNLGGEGQMILGALTTAVVGHALASLPGAITFVLAVVSGCLAGAAWAVLPALWEVFLRVPLVVTTLLLNYVGALLATYLAAYPLRDESGGSTLAQTAEIPSALQLPIIVPNTPLHAGLFAAVLAPLGVLWLLQRTSLGYAMRMTGLNRDFAETGGVPMKRTIVTTMALSGALCGLAGALLVMGQTYRYLDDSIVSPQTAWSGLAASMLAGFHPLFTFVSGFFLAALQTGGSGLQLATNVPLQLVNVIQAVIIAMVAVRLWLGRRVLRR